MNQPQINENINSLNQKAHHKLDVVTDNLQEHIDSSEKKLHSLRAKAQESKHDLQVKLSEQYDKTIEIMKEKPFQVLISVSIFSFLVGHFIARNRNLR